jgi:two-component system nitrate/nitrite response regulator NarL
MDSNRGTNESSGPVQKKIRLLLAEDHPVVRKGLAAFLSHNDRLEIVGEASDGQEALRKARELTPDVVIMDIDMPQLDGLTVTEILRKEHPQVNVLILSAHSSTHHALRIIKSGARGYVLKQAAVEELVKSVETVASGETCFSADVASLALNQLVRKNGSAPDVSQLTEREREILTLIAEGLYNKEIAARLNIGTRTVETHRERLMEKLNIHSAAGLTKFAISAGLIAMPQPQLR